MKRRLRGESVHKVDQKGRVSVPASFRRVIEEGDPDWDRDNKDRAATFVLIYGFKGRIEGYTMEGMEEIDEMISALPRFSDRRRIAERLINTKSMDAQVDDNGRIILPAKLRQEFEIEGEAVFAGMGDHFQIWSPTAYDADNAGIAEKMDEHGGLDGMESLFAMIEGSGSGS